VNDIINATKNYSLVLNIKKDFPVLLKPLNIQYFHCGVSFSYKIPDNTFYSSGSTNLKYSLIPLNSTSEPVPQWITFNPFTILISGIAPLIPQRL
jgi:hypothetical protein